MDNRKILGRLYNDYTKKFLGKIIIAAFFSILVAGSTSSIAWLLDPAIEKIFVEKDQTLIFIIPIDLDTLFLLIKFMPSAKFLKTTLSILM